MKKSTIAVALFFISSAFSLDLSRLLGLGYEPPEEPKEPQIVEIVRWRQPVCISPADGVPPCLLGIRKFQNEYERYSAKGIDEEKVYTSILIPEENEAGNKEVGNKNNEDSKERTIVFSDIVSTVPLESLETSELEVINESWDSRTSKLRGKTPEMNEEITRNMRQGKYLGSGRQVSLGPQQIYVTKVLDSPVTATLMAHNCLPDIGVPLCQDYRGSVTLENTKPVADHKPELSVPTKVEKSATGEGKPEKFLTELTNPIFSNEEEETLDTVSNKPIIEKVIHHALQQVKTELSIHNPSSLESISVLSSIPQKRNSSNPSLTVSKVEASNSNNGIRSTLLESILNPGQVGSYSLPKFVDKLSQHLTSQSTNKEQIDLSEVISTVLAAPTVHQPVNGLEINTLVNKIDQVSPRTKQSILQAIHDIINIPNKYPEKSAFLQYFHNFLNKPYNFTDTETQKDSSSSIVSTPEPSILGSFLKPDRTPSTTVAPTSTEIPVDTTTMKTTSKIPTITSRPGYSIILIENDPNRPLIIPQPSDPSIVEDTSQASFTNLLHKPQKNVPEKPSLLNIFQENEESPGKPTENLTLPVTSLRIPSNQSSAKDTTPSRYSTDRSEPFTEILRKSEPDTFSLNMKIH